MAPGALRLVTFFKVDHRRFKGRVVDSSVGRVLVSLYRRGPLEAQKRAAEDGHRRQTEVGKRVV